VVCEQGIAAGLEDALTELAGSNPAAYQATLDVVVRTADDPSILGLSSHVHYVGRKVR
jgi:hypothetical protein